MNHARIILPTILIAMAGTLASAYDGQPYSYDLGVTVNAVDFVTLNADAFPDFIAATPDYIRLGTSTASGDYTITRFTGTGQVVRWVTQVNWDGSGSGRTFVVVEDLPGGGIRVQPWRAEGSPSPFPPRDIAGGNANSVSAFRYDFNGDTFEDVVVLADDKLHVLLGSASGVLPPATWTLPGAARRGCAIDFDADGDSDIAVAVPSSSTVFVLENVGGNLAAKQTLVVSAAPYGITGADIDGDGRGDLVIASGSAGDVFVAMASTSPSPYSVTATLQEPLPGLGAYEVRLSQLDATPAPELMVGAEGYIVIAQLVAGTFQYENFLPGGPPHHTNLIATQTNPDIAGGTGTVVDIYRNNANGQYLGGDSLFVGRGPGASEPPRARAFSANAALLGSEVVAYGATGYGVNVAGGQIATEIYGQHDPEEILTGPGPSSVYGPQVRAFRPIGDTPLAKVNMFAYGTLRFGVNVTASNVDGDAFDEIVTGAGPGAVFGPHVRAFNYDGSAVSRIGKVSFFAYSTLQRGVNVAGASIDGDRFGELLTGPGPGRVFGPQIRAWNADGGSVTSIAKVNFNAFAALSYGAKVRGGDFDGDGIDEIVASPGPGGSLPDYAARFRGFNFDGQSLRGLPGFDITPAGLESAFGGTMAAVNPDRSSALTDLLVAGNGPDPTRPAHVEGYSYNGEGLAEAGVDFTAFSSAAYGCTIEGAGFY